MIGKEIPNSAYMTRPCFEFGKNTTVLDLLPQEKRGNGALYEGNGLVDTRIRSFAKEGYLVAQRLRGVDAPSVLRTDLILEGRWS